ncbi:MAG: PmeII family type II restriction endonuclease [Thermodesulfovibrionales bacterium]
MNKKIRDLIKKEFLAIARSRHNALEKLDINNLNFNPFLLKILNLDTPRKIAEFMINERLERSVVTSFGTRIQKIAKLIGGKGTGVEGGDIFIEKKGKRYYIQMKAGPNTPNKDLVNMINQLLRSATRRNAGSIALLGMTYGKREKVSDIIKRYSHVDWKIGKEFWDFIGGKGIAGEVYSIIDEVNREYSEQGITFKELYEGKVEALENSIRERYGEGEDMWQRIFDDNM